MGFDFDAFDRAGLSELLASLDALFVSSEAQQALWRLLGALGVPDYPATVHGYGTVIGTGNAIVEWNPAHKADRSNRAPGVSA